MHDHDPTPGSGPVLVTGGSGYLGSHVVDALLRAGHQVRTTVRSLDRADGVRATAARAGAGPGERLDVVQADLASDEGWAEAVKGSEYVLHVASPFPARQPRTEDEVVVPARDGALRVLRAARDHGVRRVVLTSSFAAVGYSRTGGGAYDESDWTDPADDLTPYIKSKAVAERAAWDFLAAEGGGLELAVINPPGIFGPVLDRHLSASVLLVKAMLEGALPVVPPLYFDVADVRDVAGAHLRAMTEPGAAGERFLIGSGTATSLHGMARVLAEGLGERAVKVPARELTPEEVREGARTDPALREAASQLGRVPVLRTDKARAVLGWAPRAVETTVLETAESLFRLGLVEA
ncbi:NAD-dependent epimerase/dehydratase family protein [Actinacidiphila glaucinigra]|uniref:NAD-dependent epimerase/dehydratase family protein n=1 Tax=Actinacidiphila glaucinigra TaxID=235986 RepID=UPI003672E64F